jgi:predicted transcriptional regulator
MQKKRISLEVCRDYLEALIQKDLIQSKILRKANLAQDVYNRYTKQLLKNKIIELKGDKISITNSGRVLFERLNKLIIEYDSLINELFGKASQGSG